MSSLKEVSKGLSWGSAWRIAGKIAFEVQFHSAIEMGQGSTGQSVEKQIDKARNNARINKFMISFFTAFIAISFGIVVFGAKNNLFGVASENTWQIIAVATSLFVLMAFGFLLFWGIMVSTSFISSGSASIGLYLPLSRSDAGKLALLGYIRLFDVQILTIIVAFPLAYFFATYSITGMLACLCVILISMALAITLMLILALYFYSRIQASGGSRLGSVIRVFFYLIYAIAILGFSLIYQFIGIFIPIIQGLVNILGPFWSILSFIFPFSLGSFVAHATLIPNTPFLISGLGATFLYAILAILGIRWSGNFLVHIGVGGVVQVSSSVIKPVSVKVYRPSIAVIQKDLRVAFRTPGQAIMFFLPLMMMIPIVIQFFSETGVIHVVDVFVLVAMPTSLLSFFAIFYLSIEARGMAYTLTLPLKTEIILRAKAQLLALMATMVPILVIVVSLFRPFTTPISFLIAFSQVPTVYVAAFISLVLFTRVIGGGRLVGFEVGQHVVQMFGVGFISMVFILIPLAFYGLTWIVLVQFGLAIDIAHIVSLGGMWLGIILNYLIGKIMARYLLID